MLLGCALAAPQALGTTLLRMGYEASINDSQHQAALLFKQTVEQRSEHEIEVRLYPDSQLGDAVALVKQVRDGTVDIMLSGSVNFCGHSSSICVVDTPYLFRNRDDVRLILDGDIGRRLLASLESKGIRGLSFWDNGFRMISNNQHPVKSASDLQGLIMRVPHGDSGVMVMHALGAHPMQLPYINLYQAIQRGYVNGQDQPLGVFFSSRLFQIQPFLTLTRHQYSALLLAMNSRRFNSLGNDQQQLLVEAAALARDLQRNLNEQEFGKQLDAIKAHGVIVEEQFDEESFREALRVPFLDYLEQSGNMRLLGDIIKELERFHRERKGEEKQP
ncbi:MAG: TRAP transporter substrate-binding protein [Succinivibrionaceae bacterium]|nr:TRAP transporter substrate-binding protein [Succinivibrionaceae bacterium]